MHGVNHLAFCSNLLQHRPTSFCDYRVQPLAGSLGWQTFTARRPGDERAKFTISRQLYASRAQAAWFVLVLVRFAGHAMLPAMKARRTKTEGEQLALSAMFLLGTIWYVWGWDVALGIGLLAVGLGLAVWNKAKPRA